MKLKTLIHVLLLAGLSPAALAAEPGEVRVMPAMDASRYAGTWYEISRIPNRLQGECAADVTSAVTVQGEGRLAVDNRCHDRDGRLIENDGLVRIKAPGDVNTRLEVHFAPRWLAWLPAFWSDYYVIDLDPDYRYSVVATPDRQYLWVFSRTPSLDAATYDALLERVRAQGFDTRRLVPTRQSERVGARAP